jgi:hypothetical protein
LTPFVVFFDVREARAFVPPDFLVDAAVWPSVFFDCAALRGVFDLPLIAMRHHPFQKTVVHFQCIQLFSPD